MEQKLGTVHTSVIKARGPNETTAVTCPRMSFESVAPGLVQGKIALWPDPCKEMTDKLRTVLWRLKQVGISIMVPVAVLGYCYLWLP